MEGVVRSNGDRSVGKKYGVDENERSAYKGRGDEPQWVIKEVVFNRAEREKVGEQSWSRLASSLKAFRQRKRSVWKRSEDEEGVLRRIENLMCIVG